MASNYCDDCIYYNKFVSGNVRYCNYLCATDKKRPCTPGDGCTVKIGRKVYRRKMKAVC